MNKEIQIKNAINWIDSLHKYEQNKLDGKLGDKESGFCCLGVACDLLKLDYSPGDEYHQGLRDHLGLHSDAGDLRKVDINESAPIMGAENLAELNDDTDADFKYIAKILKLLSELMFEKNVSDGIKKHYQVSFTNSTGEYYDVG